MAGWRRARAGKRHRVMDVIIFATCKSQIANSMCPWFCWPGSSFWLNSRVALGEAEGETRAVCVRISVCAKSLYAGDVHHERGEYYEECVRGKGVLEAWMAMEG